MIGCFSLAGDMLSQWRAYAQDGDGLAIGFSPGLITMAAVKLRVLYDENEQFQELLDNFMHIYEVEKSVGFKYGEEFQQHLFRIGMCLCAYKNPGFSEEREIRLAHVCGMVPAGKSIKISTARCNWSDWRAVERSIGDLLSSTQKRDHSIRGCRLFQYGHHEPSQGNRSRATKRE